MNSIYRILFPFFAALRIVSGRATMEIPEPTGANDSLEGPAPGPVDTDVSKCRGVFQEGG